MKKSLSILLVFLLVCFSIAPTVALAEDTGTINRYYFLVPNGSNGIPHQEGGYAHSWYTDNSTILFNAMTNDSEYIIFPTQTDDDEDVCYVDVDENVVVSYWTNGVDCTARTVDFGTEYYDPGESDMYPDGLDSFDGMIYVIDPNLLTFGPVDLSFQYWDGEWYYYYGDGCYGITENGNVSDCMRGDHKHIMIGDVDGDKGVSVFDVTAIQRYLAEYETLDETQMIVADADKNGVVNIFDATHIQRYLAEIIETI